MHEANVSASLRHGITILTSMASDSAARSGRSATSKVVSVMSCLCRGRRKGMAKTRKSQETTCKNKLIIQCQKLFNNFPSGRCENCRVQRQAGGETRSAAHERPSRQV